jgi:hypothetical protein
MAREDSYNSRIRKRLWSIFYGRIVRPRPTISTADFFLYALNIIVCETAIMMSSEAQQEITIQNHSPINYMHKEYHLLGHLVV